MQQLQNQLEKPQLNVPGTMLQTVTMLATTAAATATRAAAAAVVARVVNRRSVSLTTATAYNICIRTGNCAQKSTNWTAAHNDRYHNSKTT